MPVECYKQMSAINEGTRIKSRCGPKLNLAGGPKIVA